VELSTVAAAAAAGNATDLASAAEAKGGGAGGPVLCIAPGEGVHVCTCSTKS
jgi:hypothetical protein